MSTASSETFRARRRDIALYVTQHRGLLTRTGMHGISGEIFGTLHRPRWADLSRLFTYQGFEALDVWRNEADSLPATNVVVKVAVVEKTPERSADLLSKSELAAMQRLTVFQCKYAPVLYGCCRFKIRSGWTVPDVYLNVMIMERVLGRPLADLAGRRPPPGLATALKNALKDLRGYGVIHYDLHSSNVLYRGSAPTIIDFGNSIVLDPPLWTSAAFRGNEYDWHGFFAALQASGIPALASMVSKEGLPRKELLEELFDDYGMHPDPRVWDPYKAAAATNRPELQRLNARGDAARARVVAAVASSRVNTSFAGLAGRGLPVGVQRLVRAKGAIDDAILRGGR